MRATLMGVPRAISPRALAPGSWSRRRIGRRGGCSGAGGSRRPRGHDEEERSVTGPPGRPGKQAQPSDSPRRTEAPSNQPAMTLDNPEQKNYAEIERLERLLDELRASASTARETEAIREIGLEIALAVREVGAMLVNVGWEQSFSAPDRGET